MRKRDKQRQRAAGRDQQKEKKEQQVQRQLNVTHAEVMGSSDPESHDDDSAGALGDADWNDEAWEKGEREPSTQRSHNFDSSTCAAGEQETPCFEVVNLILLLSDSRMLRFQQLVMSFLYAHSPRRTTSVEISGVTTCSKRTT